MIAILHQLKLTYLYYAQIVMLKYFHFAVYLAILLLVICIVKSGLIKDMYWIIRHNTVFTICIIVVFGILALQCYSFSPIVYYDESGYILAAQNIIEHNTNQECTLSDNGNCIIYGTLPVGLGVSAVYSLMYAYDYFRFYDRVAYLTLFVYLINAILISVVIYRLYTSILISQMASLVVLSVPYNLASSTTVMPETLCNTFLLIMFYALLNVSRRDQRWAHVKYSVWLALIVAMMMSFLRVEYFAVLGLIIVYLLYQCYARIGGVLGLRNLFDREVCSIYDIAIWICIMVFLGLSCIHVIFCSSIKSDNNSLFGLSYLNASYAYYYVSNIAFIILSGLGIVGASLYLKDTYVNGNGKVSANISSIIIVMIVVFLVMLTIYSLYNYESIYRFVIPITSIYIILCSYYIYYIIEYITNNITYINTVCVIVMAVVASASCVDAYHVKRNEINRNACARHLIELLDTLEVKSIIHSGDDNAYLCISPTKVGQIYRMKNYIHAFNVKYITRKMESGYSVYVMNNPFRTIKDSAFLNSSKYGTETVFHDTQCDYHIFTVYLKDNGFLD
jgi:hypothetical protein